MWRRGLIAGVLLGSLAGTAVAAAVVAGSIERVLDRGSPKEATAAPALAAVPNLVNFQGILTDSSGGPLLDGPHALTFRIYEVASGGSLQWSESQSVTTRGGLFNVLLGSVTTFPSGVFDGTPRYLEVQVESDPPMTPRQQFVSVPYAFHADTADSANSAETANDLACTGCITEGEIAPSVGTVPPGAIILWTGGTCPAAYTRIAALDGALLKAGAAYSTPVAAGAAELPAHTHGAGSYQAASHTHNLWTDVNATGPNQGNGIGPNLTYNAEWKTTHIQPASEGTITGTTGSSGSGTVATVVLCQKD